MKHSKNQPTVRSRASVLNTDVQISFYDKHQLDGIFQYLTERGYTFSFESDGHGDSLNLEKYTLTIHDIFWAYNVTELFKKLEEFDYNMGE